MTLGTGLGDNPVTLEGDLARRTVRVGSAFAAAAAALFSVLYTATGPASFVAPNAIAAVALVLVAVMTGRDARIGVFASITIGLVLFGYQLALIGRIDNGVTVWFLVPNVATILLGLRRLAAYCGLATVVELVAIVVAARLGVLNGTAVVPDADIVMAASTIAVLVLCGIFAGLTFRARLVLVGEVKARNSALGSALEEARTARTEALEAVAARDRFFANLTHEIRTPLTGIAGSAELLADGQLRDEQRPLAEALVASTRSLVTLVNTMLDHARLAAGHAALEFAATAPRDIVRDLVSLYRAPAADRGLGFEVTVADTVPERIVTDGMRLRQILANVVANALKFTERGRIRIALDWAPGVTDASGTLVATIADTGPGIAPELHEAVFEPFVQVDASIRRGHGGTGLGLAIARQLSGYLGGTIELRSTVGAGSVFTIRVPAAVVDGSAAEAGRAKAAAASGQQRATPPPAPADGEGTAACDERGLAGLRILLAEDNDLNRAVETAMLRRAGVEVIVARDGFEAVELAATAHVDLVLMDLQMPGLDGIEATRRIRAAETGRGADRLPIVAMTGNALEDYGEACAAAGMDAFVTKPVAPDDLRAVVARTLAGD